MLLPDLQSELVFEVPVLNLRNVKDSPLLTLLKMGKYFPFPRAFDALQWLSARNFALHRNKPVRLLRWSCPVVAL